ncbi:hypothetical protein OF83DRAFT_1177716 [Amylostereum chailletii]|nr:hypothetical protein OF83DRAFT_1177716 [Amylostereum chailletii]
MLKLFLEDFTLDSADIVQLESRRITDFLLAISSLGPKDLPTSRALISVIEGESLPEWVEDLGGDEELEAAKEVVVQALPQLLEQAQHAFEHYPSQDELWGIIVVGRCCQFYKFERACVEKLKFPTFKASDRLTTDDAEKYATLVDDTHFIFDPVLDCYTEMFIKRMEDMMVWALNTFLG